MINASLRMHYGCIRTRRAQAHRLGKCESEQARAKQRKTGNGHGEETVRSEFFTHGTPPIAREMLVTVSTIAHPRSNRTTVTLHSQKDFAPFRKSESDWCFRATGPPVIRTMIGEGRPDRETAPARRIGGREVRNEISPSVLVISFMTVSGRVKADIPQLAVAILNPA